MGARVTPGVPAPALAGRLGSEVVRERAGVRLREMQARSLVNRCDSPRVPFRWTVNPYRGCAMGCRYCYATYTHEYLGLDARAEFHSVVFAKTGGEPESLRALARAAAAGDLVALGTATDPYQPGEAQVGATRRFLDLAGQLRGLRMTIATKGALILRDVDRLRRLHERGELRIQVSLISPDAGLLRQIEPWAPPPEARLEVLRRLAGAGLDVGLLLAPILPGLTDSPADLAELLARVRDAGVRRLSWNVLFLRSPTREHLLAWLDQARPRLAVAYRRAYARRAFVPEAYRARVRARVETIARRLGLTLTRDAGGLAAALPDPQLTLPFDAGATASPPAAAARC